MAERKGNAKILPADPEAIFLPFQSKWIKDDSRLKLMEKSRQIGISWSTAYKADERTALRVRAMTNGYRAETICRHASSSKTARCGRR